MRESLYILCHTNPQVLILAGLFLFVFLVLIFLNKNFHFKHIYTEVCCVLGAFRLEGGPWGRWLERASPLSPSPCAPQGPSPCSSSVFSSACEY